MTEFENLEQKLAQLVSLHKQIKDENRDLRVQAAKLESENKALSEKLAGARSRIEAVITRLPATTEEA
jgi:cell division protein ZapB